MRTKLVTILCVLLLAVMSVSFGAAFAAGTDSGSDADTLTVEAVGWGGNAEQAKTTGFTGIDNYRYGYADLVFRTPFAPRIRRCCSAAKPLFRKR